MTRTAENVFAAFDALSDLASNRAKPETNNRRPALSARPVLSAQVTERMWAAQTVSAR
jgi:hypothetical protein